jgi:hypothetical protein
VLHTGTVGCRSCDPQTSRLRLDRVTNGPGDLHLPAVAAPGRPRCSNTPFGVMVKSASKLAAAAPAAYIVAACVAGTAR